MKGYRFYEELTDKNRKAEKSKGNVVAALLQKEGRGWSLIYLPKMVRVDGGWDWNVEVVSSLFGDPNSPVCSGSASQNYLRLSCRRISEAKAREIHPRLFEYLEG